MQAYRTDTIQAYRTDTIQAYRTDTIEAYRTGTIGEPIVSVTRFARLDLNTSLTRQRQLRG